MTNFYQNNKKEILDFAKSQANELGHFSIAEIFMHMNKNIHHTYNIVEGAEGIHNIDCEQHDQIAEAMASYVASETAVLYQHFLEND